MTITLTRSPEVNGSLIKFKVWLNDEPVTKIALGEEKEVLLPKENSVIQIKQLSGKSNTLTVNDGDHVEISNGPGFRWMILLTVIYVLTITIFDGPIILISLFIAIICFFVLLRKADSFKLTKIDENSAP
ncbi:hypothetical protein ACO1PF_04775 [Alkalibacterium sp. f15]|uniref:hypothetical protein n=1 Tax=Alkalibacterium sp. f15 TaxID=3414029 RepID=UPI003BF84A85